MYLLILCTFNWAHKAYTSKYVPDNVLGKMVIEKPKSFTKTLINHKKIRYLTIKHSFRDKTEGVRLYYTV